MMADFLFNISKKNIDLNDKLKKTIDHIKTCDSMDCIKAWAKKAIL